MNYKINKGYVVQKVGDKTSIFDGEKSELITFNNTGSTIFNKIKLGWEMEKIILYFMKEFLLTEKEAKADVNDFIKKLLRERIIK